jgi:hypothetical protein
MERNVAVEGNVSVFGGLKISLNANQRYLALNLITCGVNQIFQAKVRFNKLKDDSSVTGTTPLSSNVHACPRSKLPSFVIALNQVIFARKENFYLMQKLII